jgi:chemotaxis protein MotB
VKTEQPIIIIRKRSAHAGHHGGAWKVAYADFVTALMSLFIVLWLMTCNQKVQQAVGGYFRDPFGSAGKIGRETKEGKPAPPKREDMNQIKKDLLNAIQSMPDFQRLKSQIEITITDEGLRIELLENPKGTFFENAQAAPTPTLREVLTVLSRQIGKLPNPVSIEGHTDAKPFSNPEFYSNWELSTDRANAARRLMESNGLQANQVVQVSGFADRKLRKPHQPYDASNRRISVLVRYLPTVSAPVIMSSEISSPGGARNPSHR